MVWAFCVGLGMGFPVGCYMREKGYTGRMRNAMMALNPDKEHLKTDNLE